MPASQRSNEFGEVVAWFVSKFGAFLSNDMMRNIIGQTKSSFDIRNIMDTKKILLVNLSKGRLGDLNSKLLGMIFVMKFQAAAMSRTDIPEDQRQDFSLFVDEFQNFSTDSFATIMSEARKFHLNLIVANQFTTQLSEEIRDAVFGNVGTIVSFRVGQNDVEILSRYFQPTFTSDDLLRIPNYNAIVRTLIEGVPTQPFSMVSLPTLGTPNKKLYEALKQLSAIKYGRNRLQVEKEINDRMTVKPVIQQNNSSTSALPFQSAKQDLSETASGQLTNNVNQNKPGSFLDEWLSKRKLNNQAVTRTGPLKTESVQTNQTVQKIDPKSATNLFEQNTDDLKNPTVKDASIVPSQTTEHVFKVARSSSTPNTNLNTINISSDRIQSEEARQIASEIEKNRPN